MHRTANYRRLLIPGSDFFRSLQTSHSHGIFYSISCPGHSVYAEVTQLVTSPKKSRWSFILTPSHCSWLHFKRQKLCYPLDPAFIHVEFTPGQCMVGQAQRIVHAIPKPNQSSFMYLELFTKSPCIYNIWYKYLQHWSFSLWNFS